MINSIPKAPRDVRSIPVDNTNLAQFGWYNILTAVTDGNLTKEKEVLNMPMMTVINNYMHKSLSNYNQEMNRFVNRPKKT